MELNVLIVDDHPSIIEGYKAMLVSNPYGYILNTTAAHNCESAFKFITATNTKYDIILVDYTLPPYPEENLYSGEDLVYLSREHQPMAKIMMLTSHYQSLLLFQLLKTCEPEGFLVKSDFNVDGFLTAFDTVARGEIYYTGTIINLKKEINNAPKMLDSYNRKIIMLLANGVQTKSFPEILKLSKSAIDKRKVLIKEFFGIHKGTDEDIIREARKRGLV